jgi:ABC-type bacteriocin/lantibiotic exporter with double-glycine peptidase domain
VLEKFNLRVEPCKLTALVGESGSGKSTVMKLTLGLYEPVYGSISFKGNEIVSLDSIRAKTAYVPQEAMLFRGSIYDNIACGNPTASKDDITKAAVLAGADEFIDNLEHGYDTIIYDDGKSLSGGQKQRIAIARALVKNADILLLDEITSALDRETEESILQTVKEISKYKAILLITHKTDIADNADLLCRI